jgi:hypothetical protein
MIVLITNMGHTSVLHPLTDMVPTITIVQVNATTTITRVLPMMNLLVLPILMTTIVFLHPTMMKIPMSMMITILNTFPERERR